MIRRRESYVVHAAVCAVVIGAACTACCMAAEPPPATSQPATQPAIDWAAEMGAATLQKPDAAAARRFMEHIGSASPAQREATIRLLLPLNDIAAEPIVAVFAEGGLASRLAALELLEAWGAPVAQADPWDPQTLTPARLAALEAWAKSPAHSNPTTRPVGNVVSVASELARMVACDDPQETAAIRERLARFGPAILPEVITAAHEQEGDAAQERLAALRYRLVCSEALATSWPGGIDRLASRDIPIRRKAAQDLSSRSKASDLALLRQLFSDPDPLVREIALAAIQNIGADAARDALLTMLQDPDPNVRAAVLKQLAEKPDKVFVAALVEYARKEQDPDLVLHAVRALRATKGSAVAKGLLTLLKHPNWQVRAESAEAAKECLGDLGEEQKADLYAGMLTLLDDPDAFVVSRALQCLQTGDLEAALQPMLKVAQRHPELAQEVVKAISSGSNMKRLAGPHLREFCKHSDPAVRAAALLGLCQIATDSVHAEVLAALRDPDAQVRVAGTKALYGLIEDMRPFAPHTRLTPRSEYSISTNRQTVKPDAWVKKFQAGQDRPAWMNQAAEICRQLLTDDNPERRIYAAMPLVAMSHNPAAVQAIMKAVEQQPHTANLAAHALIWLPAEERIQLSDRLLALATDQQAAIVEIMAVHSDAASAERLWSLLARADTKPGLAAAVHDSLRTYYVGEQTYNAPKLPAAERKRIVGELRPKAEKGAELQRTVAMALLLPVDASAAAAVAKAVRADAGTGEWLRLDALQVQMLAMSDDEAMAEAIAVMSGKDAAMRKVVLPYLIGSDGSLQQLRGTIYISYSRPSRSRTGDDGKPLLPEYPKGLDPQILTTIMNGADEDLRPMAAYLLALQKDRKALDYLIAYWRTHADGEWRDLTYRAIAVMNDDSLTPVLEEIYRTYQGSQYDIREFYWTIRKMQGPKVLTLRKQIRQDVGMDQLR